MTVLGRSSLILWGFLLSDIGTASPWGDPQISVGCFISGWKDEDASSEQAEEIDTVEECFQACRANSSCNVFNFIALTKRCFVGGGSLGNNLVRGGVGDISGPRECDFPASACKAKLNSGAEFPGTSMLKSMNAWSSGFQPQATQCWERDGNGTLTSCDDVTVLGGVEDVKKCVGMLARDLPSEEQCKAYCKANVECSVWVIQNGQCLTGLGLNCQAGTPGMVEATAGQRLMHGTTRSLAKLVATKVNNAAVNVFTKEELMGYGDEQAKVACKHACLSSVECQYWQLIKETGCWIENAPMLADTALYPLTTDNLDHSGGTVIDGEFLMHVCKSPEAEKTLADIKDNTTPAPAESNAASESSSVSFSSSHGRASWPWWAWLLVGIFAACCCASLIGGCFFALGLCDKNRSKKKKKRGLQHRPKSLTPRVEVAQPSRAFQQQVPVPTTVSPVPTYQPVRYVVQETAPAPHTLVQPATMTVHLQPTFQQQASVLMQPTPTFQLGGL